MKKTCKCLTAVLNFKLNKDHEKTASFLIFLVCSFLFSFSEKFVEGKELTIVSGHQLI